MGSPNEAEPQALERFSDRIAIEDLRACFALFDCDRVLIFEQQRLGLAVSLERSGSRAIRGASAEAYDDYDRALFMTPSQGPSCSA